MNTNSRVVTLKIDDQDIGAQEDQTILEAARDHGIDIPTLCHLEGLSDVGACRLCLLEIEGTPRLSAACTTFTVGCTISRPRNPPRSSPRTRSRPPTAICFWLDG